MTDEPAAPDDARDERVAALLAVPPLDDVTRRRLVRDALGATEDAPAPPRSRSRLAVAVPVAAAILVGLVVGAVIVQRPSDDPPTAAQPASSVPAPQGDSERAAEADDGAPAVAQSPSVAPASLGNLGIVDDEADLRIAVSLAEGQPAGPEAATAAEAACASTDPAGLGLVAVTALGTALHDDAPVVVLVGTDAEGRRRAIALDASCTPVLQTLLD